MLFHSTFYPWISLHFKDIDWSLTALLLWEVYYYVHLINRETEAQQKEVICLGPHSAPVEELGLDMSSLDGLGVPIPFNLPYSCLPLQLQCPPCPPPSPELSGALGDARSALSPAVIPAKQAAMLPALSEKFWACIDKSHWPRLDLIAQTALFLAYQSSCAKVYSKTREKFLLPPQLL